MKYALKSKYFAFSYLVPPADSNLFYEMTYRSYFVAVEMEQQKWRTKIVMEKNLYDEWAEKFFAGELEKIKDEAGKMQINF